MQVSFIIFASLPAMLFAMVPVWFVLILTLFNRLETNHPEKYTAMGRPSLFRLSNGSNGWPTLRFLVAREHKAMADPGLSKLSDAMLIFFTVYLLLFGAGFVTLGVYYLALPTEVSHQPNVQGR